MPAFTRLAAALLAVMLLSCGQPWGAPESSPEQGGGSPAAYRAEIESWRAGRDESLRQRDGWLTLAGLYWLRPGENTAGSAPGNSLVFPPTAPAKIGVFILEDSKVRIEAAPDVNVSWGDEPVRAATLDPLAAESQVLATGSFSFHAIERAGRIGIRLRDSESEALANFSGMEHFPIEPSWRIEARFEPYGEPRPIKVPNIIGTDFDELTYGRIAFEVEGKLHRLDPLYKPEDGFFVVFGDETNGNETYRGGRFVATGPPGKDGSVVLDFNKAYNPPCVFTPYATCPLPPPQNRLPFRIAAGELMYRSGGGH